MVSSHSFGALASSSFLRLRSKRSSVAPSATDDSASAMDDSATYASICPAVSSDGKEPLDTRSTTNTSDVFDSILSTPKSLRNLRPSRMKTSHSYGSTGSARTTSCTTESVFEAFGGCPAPVLGNNELAAVARSNSWHLVWPQDGHPTGTFAGTDIILVVHTKSKRSATSEVVRSFRQVGSLGCPLFVLLFDMSGDSPEDFETATSLQQELMREGADDVLCNVRTPHELRLAVAMATHRRSTKLEEVSHLQANYEMEAERSKAERAKELDEAHACGIFWQMVDRLFKDFPTMDPRLPEQLVAGTKVGACALDSCLGQGSFGKVYGAVNERTGSREAVKVVAKGSIRRCKMASALYRELHMHSRLKHKNIIRQIGVMHGPMHVFIRLEEASKRNLFQVMKATSGSLPLEDTKRFQEQLSDAVAYCHAQGVAHRDLKPENIALDATGRDIKVLDFGYAIEAKVARTEVVGSFPFMAPEILIASNSSPYEPAGVDVWSCAVILVEMLFGVHYFNRMLGWERTTRVSPKRHAELTEKFRDVSVIGKLLQKRFDDEDVSPLEDLLRGMFEIAPARRWDSKRVAESKWPSRP